MVHLGYERSIEDFLKDDENYIIGKIIEGYKHELNDLQEMAWRSQINILKNQLTEFKDGDILFEYKIPRMGAEIDNILLIDGIIFIIEFKVGESEYNPFIEQIENYRQLLNHYHFESREKLIVPILISTEAKSEDLNIGMDENDMLNILKSNGQNLSCIISKICDEFKTDYDLSNWSKSKYAPTPSILESALKLYETHEVKDIQTYNSNDLFLNETQEKIDEIISDSKRNNQKSIIFLTGVPGAGKTLIGLNTATKRSATNDDPAVYLSGNGPLVKVLQEALARDSAKRNNIKKKEAEAKVVSFIQAIHHFRDEAIKNEESLHEKIVIFDESQRAWTQHETEKYMRNKNKIENFGMSEPEFLISIMDRQKNWAVIICLVGQGQEINKGEAGISEWFKAIENKFSHWNIYADMKSLDITNQFDNLKIHNEDKLFLYSTIRSLNASNLPNFIEQLLNNNKTKANEILNEFNSEYPLYITRNLDDAKKWIKQKIDKEDESLKYGLLAQSNGLRLIPEGIFVKNNINQVAWFLNETGDVRSSNHLEIPATEFDIQGLEIDYSIVAWDANLRYINNKFEFKEFKGTVWNNINQEHRKNYLLNSYRVLLTRARQGMVIFVPEGDDEDQTRKKEYYDGTYEYLKSIGIKKLELN